jgi:cytochrome c oxidase cbb3-type subunit 4
VLDSIIGWILEYRGYLAFFFLLFLTYMMYGYIYHLYSSEKKGTRNYEKYANLALDDDYGTEPLEARETKKNSEKVKKKET